MSLQQAVSWLGVAEVRNIATAVMLRGEVFNAPGHEPESEDLWREAWLAGLWAKEIARQRRKHVESAFLAALMHRTGAALALKILSQFEAAQRTVMDARTFADLVAEFEPAFGRLLMDNWRLPEDVQSGASGWRNYRNSPHSDLAGTVNAANLLAAHTLHPQLLGEEVVIDSPVFEQLGVFPDDRRRCSQSAITCAASRGIYSVQRDRFDLDLRRDPAPPARRPPSRPPKRAFTPRSSSAKRRSAAPVCCQARFPARRCANRRCAIGGCRAVLRRWPLSCAATPHCPPCSQGVDVVIAAQDRYLQAQLARNRVELIRGRGVFLDANRIEVERLDGSRRVLRAPRVLLATGSRPRHVPAIEVDHEHIVDSDSILSLAYIPRSMVVLGSGVIACEYASIFAALGCAVTLLDKAAEPLGFLDPALRTGFLTAFQSMGGRYQGGAEVTGARFDGFSQVEVQVSGGDALSTDIVFAAFGRVANLDGIGLDRLQLAVSARATCRSNARFETNIPGVYAAGDAIGPPALACAAADQGGAPRLPLRLPPPARDEPRAHRRVHHSGDRLRRPVAGEAAAEEDRLVVGRADFAEVARAHIAGEASGFLRCCASAARGASSAFR